MKDFYEKEFTKAVINKMKFFLKIIVTILLILAYIVKFDWIVIDVSNFKIYQVYDPDVYVILGMVLGFIVRTLAIYFMWSKPKKQK